MGPKTPLLGDKLPPRRKSPEVLLSGSTWSSPHRMYLVITEITMLISGQADIEYGHSLQCLKVQNP